MSSFSASTAAPALRWFQLLTLFFVASLSSELVTLPNGMILQGVTDGAVTSFKGVRYAEPPVGKLRWAPPLPYVPDNITEVYDATKFRTHCIQSVWPNGSEDCLYLNVFVGADVDTSKAELPVLAFIHGGSYVNGASKFYSGADMVEYWHGKAVVVTVDYRLNVFGFLGSEALRSQDADAGSTGNYGLQDQRMAMQWIRGNIAAFGGDGGRLTIMGESAGGGSVTNHLTMKRSWGHYTAAIVESGSFAPWSTQPMNRAQATFDKLLALTGCDTASTGTSADNEDGGVACLLNKSTDEIYSAHISNTDSSVYLSPFAPTADGVEINTHPWIALANGEVADVPVLHGTNSDEGLMFTALDQRRRVNESELVQYWSEEGNYTKAEIVQLQALYVTDKEDAYPVTNHPVVTTTQWWALQRSQGDYMFSCPAKYASQQLATHTATGGRSSSTYLYHFEFVPFISSYVIHSAEMPYVFHWRLGMYSDARVADEMSSYWARFVTSVKHDVNHGTDGFGVQDLPTWPSYSTAEDEVLAIKEPAETKVVVGLKEAECAFHIARIDAVVRCQFPAA